MKKLAIIIAILMTAGSITACSQAEKANPIQQKPTYSATADEAKSRINTDVFRSFRRLLRFEFHGFRCMKKLAIIIAILMAASSICACSQAEKANPIQQKPTYSATADEAKSRINTDVFRYRNSQNGKRREIACVGFSGAFGRVPDHGEKSRRWANVAPTGRRFGERREYAEQRKLSEPKLRRFE